MEYILILKRLCTLNPQDQKFLTTATGVPFKGDGGGGKGEKEKEGERKGERKGKREKSHHI